MEKNLPTTPIADGIQISPEGLLVANAYLELGGDIEVVAKNLNLPREVVVQQISRRDVRVYIDTVFLNSGFASRNKIFAAMEAIIEKKLLELEEAEIGSSKDILEILQAMHKMRMDEVKAMTELEKARNGSSGSNIKKQTNIQINDKSGGENYNVLLKKLRTF